MTDTEFFDIEFDNAPVLRLYPDPASRSDASQGIDRSLTNLLPTITPVYRTSRDVFIGSGWYGTLSGSRAVWIRPRLDDYRITFTLKGRAVASFSVSELTDVFDFLSFLTAGGW